MEPNDFLAAAAVIEGAPDTGNIIQGANAHEITVAALEHINGCNPYEAMSLSEMQQARLEDFIPVYWGVVFHRTWHNGNMLWTVTLSVLNGPDEGATINNTVAARCESFDLALCAALCRAAAIIHYDGDDNVAAAA